MGILQASIPSGLPCPLPGDLPNTGIEPRFPALQADSLPSEPSEKPITKNHNNNPMKSWAKELKYIFPKKLQKWAIGI